MQLTAEMQLTPDTVTLETSLFPFSFQGALLVILFYCHWELREALRNPTF
jgi:hypothetical protein